MEPPPVVFGIVSPGRWGLKLLDAARISPRLRMGGVFSRDTGRAGEIAAAYGGRAYSDYAGLLEDREIEAVLVPTPHFLHHGQAMAAMAAGKHVFVEKPIATSIEEGEALAAESRRRRLILAVGHQGRFTGMARKVRSMIEAGDFGRLVTVAVVQGYPLFLGAGAGGWRDAEARVPGGPLDEFGVHYFDLLQYWFGPAQRITGLVNRSITANPVPDAADAVIEYPSGVLASYTGHFVSVGVSRLSLYGTKGALEINRFGEGPCAWQGVSDMAAARSGGAPLESVDFPGPRHLSTALTAELEDFASAIRMGRQPQVGADEAIAALRVSRAVLQANRAGGVVDPA